MFVIPTIAGSLDFDLMRLALGHSWNLDGQNAIFEGSLDFGSVYIGREREVASKGTILPLHSEIVLFSDLFLKLPLSLKRKNVVFNVDLNILSINLGAFRLD